MSSSKLQSAQLVQPVRNGAPTQPICRPISSADLALARPAATDQEKFDRLIESDTREAADDPLSRLFEDKTIDPETGALLGRFIAEERDSERRLRAARLALQPIRSGADRDPGDEALLSDILTRLDRLSVTLDSLKSLRAQ